MNATSIASRVPLKGACAVAAWRTHAFLGCGTDGVFGIDLTNPASPVVRGRLFTDGMEASRLYVDNGRLYVAARGGGLHYYDVTNPANPFGLGRFSGAAIPYVEDVWAHGRTAIVVGADGINGRLAVLDVGNPAGPSVIGLHTHVAQESAGYQSVGFDGRSALAGTQRGDLHVLDVRNPGRIVRTGEYLCTLGTELRPAKAWGVAASPGRAYVANAGVGLVVLDTSRVINPTPLGVFQSSTPLASAYRIVLDGARAYVASGWGGLQVLDVTNPAAPRLSNEVAPPQASYLDVSLFGAFALLANGGRPQGLDVVRVR